MPRTNSTKQKTSLKYYLLEPATFKLDGGAMYGIIPKPLWNKFHPADELNRVDLALRLWVIESENKLIVVDTGIGDYHDDKFNKMFDVKSSKHPLEQALNQIGKSCSDVTDLVISHLHFDHVGGIGILKDGQWQPAFEKATLHLHQEHLQYAKKPTARDTGSFHTHSFLPVIEQYQNQGKLTFHSGQEGVLMKLNDSEVLSFKCSHGHTPWLMHPYTDEMIYLADLIPTKNHISTPWVMGYDISPGITTEDKENMLPFIIENNLMMIFEHDPLYWGSRVEKNAKNKYVALEPVEKHDQLAYQITA